MIWVRWEDFTVASQMTGKFDDGLSVVWCVDVMVCIVVSTR